MSIYQKKTFISGMTFHRKFGDTVPGPKAAKALKRLKKTGIKWISISFSWYQESSRSVKIKKHPDLSPDDTSLINLIDYFQKNGIKVMLKPIVASEDNVLPKDFLPENWDNWFRSYQKFILHYAKLAATQNVALFCIGSENTTGNRRTQIYWRNLIYEVRNHFEGKITFASSWTTKNAYRQIYFWPLLDYIGIQAHLTEKQVTGKTEIEVFKILDTKGKQIESWHKKSFPDIPVLFTDSGHPGQEFYHSQAFFEVFKDKKWLKGVFTPNWKKPFRIVLKEYFG